jgi:hypothetical protein
VAARVWPGGKARNDEAILAGLAEKFDRPIRGSGIVVDDNLFGQSRPVVQFPLGPEAKGPDAPVAKDQRCLALEERLLE